MYTTCYDQQILQAPMHDTPTVSSTLRTHQSHRQPTKPSKQLPEKAVRLMNAWYAAHEDNPYPNRNDLDYLATNGDIKESQVKAWFSNKRNRTQNTHPKRAKRYLVRSQAQQHPSSWNEPEKIHVADQLEQRAAQMQPQCYPNHPVSPMPSTNWTWLPPESYEYYHAY